MYMYTCTVHVHCCVTINLPSETLIWWWPETERLRDLATERLRDLQTERLRLRNIRDWETERLRDWGTEGLRDRGTLETERLRDRDWETERMVIGSKTYLDDWQQTDKTDHFTLCAGYCPSLIIYFLTLPHTLTSSLASKVRFSENKLLSGEGKWKFCHREQALGCLLYTSDAADE